MTHTPFSNSPPASADMNEFMIPAMPDAEGDLNIVASPLALDFLMVVGLMRMMIHLKVRFCLTPRLNGASV